MTEPAARKQIFVITAPSIVETKMVSWAFMMKDKIPYDRFSSFADTFGYLSLNTKSDDHVDPWKFVRNEPGAVGDDGVKRWTLNIFNAGNRGGPILAGGVNETPNDPYEPGLAKLLEEAPKCVLLMHRDLFERFEMAATSQHFQVDVHHHDSELETG